MRTRSRWLLGWRFVGVVIASIIVAMFALMGFFAVTRGTPVRRVVAFGDSITPAIEEPAFRRTLELLTGMTLKAGNGIEIMTSGDETYPRLWRDIASAQHTITVQMYYCNAGKIATRMKDLLIERAHAGVKVLVLFDAFGAQGLTSAYLDSLEDGGVQVAQFRPVHWYSLQKATNRSHIRVVVIDGEIGWTGGFGLDDKWTGDGLHVDQWRDTNVRFEGPAVMQLQATFAGAWGEATGILLVGDAFFPPDAFVTPDGSHFAALLHTAPTIGSTAAERFLALSIAGARHTLYISNSYFVPDDDFRRLLEQAAARGVDVRVITAGPLTDVKTTRYAGRSSYEELLTHGVRVYEFQPSMYHAKTLVADGQWSAIGTMNFDNRSMVFNDESNLVVLDKDVGARMDSIFATDIGHSKEITLPEFRKRGLKDHLLERAARLISRVL